MTKYEILLKLLRKEFMQELCFDEEIEPGVVFCSDSNAMADLNELAAKIIEVLK